LGTNRVSESLPASLINYFYMSNQPILSFKSDPQYDYIVAIFVGIGIAMFMSSTDELTFDFDVYGEHTSAKWTGVMLLLFFLFFDSFTSQVSVILLASLLDYNQILSMFTSQRVYYYHSGRAGCSKCIEICP
jgi:hypothetical protein